MSTKSGEVHFTGQTRTVDLLSPWKRTSDHYQKACRLRNMRRMCLPEQRVLISPRR